jgi:sugar lactone lactonase YvrE
MRLGIFNSKFLTVLTLCLFIFLLTSEASSLRGFQGAESFAKLLSEGEAFYKSKEYDKAIIRYLEAYMQAKDNTEFSEVYMHLGLTYTANGQKDKAREYLLKLLELQPDKKIDEQKYPADFVILFYQAKIEALKPAAEAAKPVPSQVVPEEESKAPPKTEEAKKPEPKKEEPKPKTEEKKAVSPATTKQTESKVETKTQPVKKDETKELPEKLKEVPGVETTKKEEVPKKEEKPAAKDIKAATTKEEKTATKDVAAPTQEESKEPVVKEQTAQEAKVEGKKKIPWLLIAGVAVIGGALAYLLLSGSESSEEEVSAGSIQVNSSPTGAKIFLDGTDTGQVTNATLTGISPGSHEVKVSKEGYVDREETVSVTGGQTAIVDVSLSKHTISVSNPKANDIWVKGQTVQIKWSTGGSSATRSVVQSHFNPLLSDSGNSRAFLRLKVYREREAMRAHNHSMRAGGGGEEDQDGLARVRKVIGELSPTVRERTPASVTQPVDGKSNSGNSPGLLNINPNSQSGQYRANSSSDMNIQAVSQVKIELYQGNKRVTTIANSTQNDGQHNWIVASNVPDGFDYKVKVSAAEEPSVSGTSKEFMVRSDYTLAAKWGSRGSGDDQFNAPMGITVKQNKVYIVEDVNARIKIYTPQGTLLNMWGAPGKENNTYNSPRGVAVASNGNIYIADTGNERIMVYKPSGTYIRQWGKRGGGNGQFRSPTGISIDKAGFVYVADSYNFRIQKFNADGKFIGQIGTRGTGDGQFGLPVGVDVDNSENVYVVDSENNRIQKFGPSGQFITKWGKKGTGDAEFSHPVGIAIGTDENVYVTDSENNRIQKFDSMGNFISTWGTQGDGDAQFRFPSGISVDTAGRVYISDSGNYRIMKFKVAE